MNHLIMLTFALLLMASPAMAKDLVFTKSVDGYEVTTTIDKNPPVVGKNNVKVSIKDAAGKPLTTAKVTVNYFMPAMPGMPAMDYNAEAKLNGNAYDAVMDLSMSGSWNISVKVNNEGKRFSAKFSIDAH